MWVVSTGKLRFRFTRAHGDHRITAMALDSNKRRLITGADNGQLKMWNFSSGACIKTMSPRGAGMEVTGITCTQVGQLGFRGYNDVLYQYVNKGVRQTGGEGQ